MKDGERGAERTADTAKVKPGLRNSLLGALLLALILFYLNSSLTFQNLWPTPWIRLVPELSVEVLGLLGALALLRGLGLRAGARTRLALAALLLLATLLRYTEVAAPPLFGRGLNLYWDVRHLPNLIDLFWRSTPAAYALLSVAAVAGLLVLIFIVNLRCLSAVDRLLGDVRLRRVCLALGVVAVVAYTASFVPGQTSIRRAFAIPAASIAAHHIGLGLEAERLRRASPQELAAILGPAPETAGDLSGLKGENVFVFFLESYGTTLFDNTDYARRIAPSLETFAARLEAAGWQAASRRLVSPSFGGGSWWAHATLLSGARLGDQTLYNLFVSTGRETLVDAFKRAGYRTLAVQPGIQRHWPESRAFPFDRIYDAKALDYPGPDFGFWRIPDQFTLHRLHERELRQPNGPLFAFAVLIMSHMPFHPLPPYVEDWQRLGTGEAYDEGAAAAQVAAQPDWSLLGPRYVDSMVHNYRIIGDFVTERLPPRSLVVLVGDHQPPALVAGEDQPWTVPIHILSRAPDRLQPFLERGYEPGLRPSRGSAAGMEGFYGDFLAAARRKPTAARGR